MYFSFIVPGPPRLASVTCSARSVIYQHYCIVQKCNIKSYLVASLVLFHPWIGRCVLKASAEFHLTDDGRGVVWQNPSSQQWSSDESDTAWDVCDEGQETDESRRHDLAREEPEDWDEDENFPSSDGCSFDTANKTEVCWDSVNDCKFWDGKDWSELEESGAQDQLEEEHNMNIHYRDNVTVQQESDGSLNNDSDDNDIDDLVWIIDNSTITDTNPN